MAAEAPPLSWGDIDESSEEPIPEGDVLYETYPSISQRTLALTDEIVKMYRESGLFFTKMAIPPKGANLLGSILPERFGMDNDQLIHPSVQSYKGMGQVETGKLIISRHMPTKEEIEGQHFLLAEEVWDTGITAHFLRRFLLANRAAAVMVATLYFKPGKNLITGGEPDVYIAKYDGWVDFPWERERRRRQPVPGVSQRTHGPLVIDPDGYISWIAAQNGLSQEEIEQLGVY